MHHFARQVHQAVGEDVPRGTEGVSGARVEPVRRRDDRRGVRPLLARGAVPACRVGAVGCPSIPGEPEVHAAACHAGTAAGGRQLGRARSARARIANAVRSWSVLRFEVTEHRATGVDGERFSHTLQLGSGSGVRAPTATSWSGRRGCGRWRREPTASAAELDTVLGRAWDEALELHRGGGDAAEVTWLGRGVG